MSKVIMYDSLATTNGKPVGIVYVRATEFESVFTSTKHVAAATRFPDDVAEQLLRHHSWYDAQLIDADRAVDIR